MGTEQALSDRDLARRNVTCPVVSHRRVVLQRVDRIVLLKDERMETTGSLDVLLATSKKMRDLGREVVG